ncbi:MAG: T9SS type A sorting domain-containing protein, partial [Candidatus Altarchaeum sp.]|nr:T9SS type A sorting domain-containing protein [Candidatus Altarchaeum sp.]
NLSDASTYSVNCGQINSGQWFVKNNFCSLITCDIVFPGNSATDPPLVAPVTVIVSGTGNLDCGEIFPDGAFIKYSINYGPWYTLQDLSGCAFQENTTITSNLNLCAPAGARVRIKVSLANDDKTEKLWIKNGDIIVGETKVADSTNWIKRFMFPLQNNMTSNANTFKVYPNPVTNGENIMIDYTNFEIEMGAVWVVLYDMLGKELYSKVIVYDNGGFIHAIAPENHLSPGVYLIIGKVKNEIYKTKLIVK